MRHIVVKGGRSKPPGCWPGHGSGVAPRTWPTDRGAGCRNRSSRARSVEPGYGPAFKSVPKLGSDVERKVDEFPTSPSDLTDARGPSRATPPTKPAPRAAHAGEERPVGSLKPLLRNRMAALAGTAARLTQVAVRLQGLHRKWRGHGTGGTAHQDDASEGGRPGTDGPENRRPSAGSIASRRSRSDEIGGQMASTAASGSDRPAGRIRRATHSGLSSRSDMVTQRRGGRRDGRPEVLGK